MNEQININQVVCWQQLPAHYTGIEPFTAKIYHYDLSDWEKDQIQTALVNACHEIVRRRGGDNAVPFQYKNDK